MVSGNAEYDEGWNGIDDTAGEISGLMIPVAGSRFLGAWSYLVFGCPFEVSRPVRVSGLA
jgi:hypothetical protein